MACCLALSMASMTAVQMVRCSVQTTVPMMAVQMASDLAVLMALMTACCLALKMAQMMAVQLV